MPEPKVYVFPERPPGVNLWPAAGYAVHCTAGGVTIARNAGGVVEGVIRDNNGKLEVLTQGDLKVWAPLNPSRPPITSLTYYRVGPCWVGGHGHGQDGEVGASEDDWFPVVHGRAPTDMEKVDIKYFPVNTPPAGLRWLQSEWRRLTGEQTPAPQPPKPAPKPPVPPAPPAAPTPTAPTTPTTSPTPPATPPAPAPLPTPPVIEPPPQPAPPLDGPPPRTPPALSAASKQTIKDLRSRIAARKRIGDNLQPRLVALLDEVEKLLP